MTSFSSRRVSVWGAVCVGFGLGLVALVGCAPEAEPSTSASVSASPTSSASAPAAGTPTAAAPSPEGTDAPRTAAPLPTEEGELDDTIELSTGVEVDITAAKAITVTAETPGEVDGEAVAVHVTVTNGTTEDVSVDSAVVALVADDGELGIPTTAGSARLLQGELAPGDSTDGVYVFMLDNASERSVTITVNYAAGEPVASFTGRTS